MIPLQHSVLIMPYISITPFCSYCVQNIFIQPLTSGKWIWFYIFTNPSSPRIVPWLETPFSSEKDTGHQEDWIKSWPQAILVLTLGKLCTFHEPVYSFHCSEKLIFLKGKHFVYSKIIIAKYASHVIGARNTSETSVSSSFQGTHDPPEWIDTMQVITCTMMVMKGKTRPHKPHLCGQRKGSPRWT